MQENHHENEEVIQEDNLGLERREMGMSQIAASEVKEVLAEFAQLISTNVLADTGCIFSLIDKYNTIGKLGKRLARTEVPVIYLDLMREAGAEADALALEIFDEHHGLCGDFLAHPDVEFEVRARTAERFLLNDGGSSAVTVGLKGLGRLLTHQEECPLTLTSDRPLLEMLTLIAEGYAREQEDWAAAELLSAFRVYVNGDRELREMTGATRAEACQAFAPVMTRSTSSTYPGDKP